jgi:hypothetical protein
LRSGLALRLGGSGVGGERPLRRAKEIKMSTTTISVEQSCRASTPCDAVELLIEPREKALGGFSVRRALPTAKQRMVGPWVFFDHMGPADFRPGEGIDVRPHPHINLATVTYLFEGEILHRDSVGSHQLIKPGDINLMVAGRGIVHSERGTPEAHEKPHRTHGLQLWLALPTEHEETAPAFYHHEADAIPQTRVNGVPVRILMGTAFGKTSPVKTFANTLYMEAMLETGQQIAMPAAEERAIYVVSGQLKAGEAHIPQHSMAILSAETGITLTADRPSRAVIIGGESLDARHIEWNFVSSRKGRIEQAKADWREGRFPTIAGDEDEFIPGPD